MALQFLVRDPNGQEHLVISMDGHDDCEILEENVTTPRVAGCERIDGKWKVTDRRAARRAALHPVERLLDHIEKLEARLEALETR